MKKLFLSGGGDSKDSRNLDTKFLESLGNKNILYIPIALEGSKKHSYVECFKWITKTLSKVSGKEKIKVEMLTDLNGVSIDYIKQFSAIYIGGGNTFKLLQRIKENKFDRILKIYNSKYGPIYGGSAGAIILGRSIETVKEENKNGYTHSEGLDILDGISVRCHFKNTQKEIDLIRDFVSKHKRGVLALTENSGLIINNNKIMVIGPGEVFYFSNGEISLDIALGKINYVNLMLVN